MPPLPRGIRNISTSIGGRLTQFAHNPTPIFTRSALPPPTPWRATSCRRFRPIHQATQHSGVPCSRSCAIFGGTKHHLLLFRMNSTARIKMLTASSCPSGQPHSNRLAKRKWPTRKAGFTWAYIGTSTPKRASIKAIRWLTMFSTTPSSQSSKRAHEKEGAVPSRFGVEFMLTFGEENDHAARLFCEALPAVHLAHRDSP